MNEVIRPLSDPWHEWGSLAVLKGNLAPATAVTKPIAIAESMLKFSGPARCFDSEEDASEAVLAGRIKEGDVLVVRYEGPKGGPGMREMARLMKLAYGAGLALKTALVTDGRFSGTNNGCFVGHVSPEAWGRRPHRPGPGRGPGSDRHPRRQAPPWKSARPSSRRGGRPGSGPRRRSPRDISGSTRGNAESADKGAVLRTRD